MGLAVQAFASGAGSGAAAKTARVGAKGSLPLALSKPVLTYFAPGNLAWNNVDSFEYKDNTFTKKVVDETGIDLRVTSTVQADATERLNIMLNTGDYPDIIGAGGVDWRYYAKEGIFIALDKYDLQSYPTIKKVFDTYPSAKSMVSANDGLVYGLPQIQQCLHCTYSYGRIWYNAAFIRDNNRKIPETLDEFTEYLRWVKTGDPNKNGRKTELGIVFSKNSLYNFMAFIAKAHMPFVYTGGYFGVSLDSGRKVTEQYRDPLFRQALAYAAGLYKEGLIVPDSFSMTDDQVTQLLRSSDAPVGINANAWSNHEAVLGPNMGDYFELPPLKTASGSRYGPNGESWSNISAAYFITDKCKDPELAVALYDYLISGDMSLYGWGEKGVQWDDADTGAVGFGGGKATWKLLLANGSAPLNTSWGFGLPRISWPQQHDELQADGYDKFIKYYQTADPSLRDFTNNSPLEQEGKYIYFAKQMTQYALPDSVFLPFIAMDEADTSRYSDITAVLDPFKNQVIVEFITGVRNINSDTDWNAYLAELDRLGSKEYVQILQKYVK
jgi:putative aldouronate transport system substrate-binding protein